MLEVRILPGEPLPWVLHFQRLPQVPFCSFRTQTRLGTFARTPASDPLVGTAKTKTPILAGPAHGMASSTRHFLEYTSAVTLREFFLENFAGDLEYHPRRVLLNLTLGIAALCFWMFSPSAMQFTTVPLVFALGSLTLLLKGIFLFRRSSEGIGLSEQDLANLTSPANRRSLPSIANQVAQNRSGFRHRRVPTLAVAQRR
jgi:hypothetical protein